MAAATRVDTTAGVRYLRPGALSTIPSPITSYGGVAAAGNGVPVVRAVGRLTAQAAAAAAIATFTPATDGLYDVVANLLVTTATLHSFTVTCAYTDEGGTTRTLTLSFVALAGSAIVTTIANAGGAVPYAGIGVKIRAKGGTAITIATTGTFTTVAYNVEALITQYT